MRLVVLHSTESDPGSARAVADFLVREGKVSHEVFDPSNDQTISLVRAGEPSKALKNLAGGVETNRRDSDRDGYADVYQIEIVGRAEQIPRYPDEWHRNLAKHIAIVCYLTGTPLTFPCRFVPYPQSYGVRAPQRLSFAAWNAAVGVVGHQHVPENDHGDPGDISRTIHIIQAGADDMSARAEEQIDHLWRVFVGNRMARHGDNTGANHDGITPILNTNHLAVLIDAAQKSGASKLDQLGIVAGRIEALVREVEVASGGEVSGGDARKLLLDLLGAQA